MSPCQCLTFTLNDLTHQQLSWKYFVQTQKNRSEKGTRPSARLFFCLLQVISQLTYIYLLHLLRPFKWGFCLHVYSGDFASCLTFIHSWKKFKEIHHKGFDWGLSTENLQFISAQAVVCTNSSSSCLEGYWIHCFPYSTLASESVGSREQIYYLAQVTGMLSRQPCLSYWLKEGNKNQRQLCRGSQYLKTHLLCIVCTDFMFYQEF